MDEVLSDLEDNPIPFARSGDAKYDSFSIYNDLLYKSQNYDIYGRYLVKKDCYEECRIFLTVEVGSAGETVYKDTIEEDDTSYVNPTRGCRVQTY